MDERGADKVKAEIALQARFNEKNKRSKGKFAARGKSNFQNFGSNDSQNSSIRRVKRVNVAPRIVVIAMVSRSVM